MQQRYHLVNEAPELLSHEVRVGPLQHQQHLLIQRFVQRRSKAHVGGLVISPMRTLQRNATDLHAP